MGHKTRRREREREIPAAFVSSPLIILKKIPKKNLRYESTTFYF